MAESWEVMPKMTSELESVTADSEFYFVMNKKFHLHHTFRVQLPLAGFKKKKKDYQYLMSFGSFLDTGVLYPKSDAFLPKQ